MKTQTVQVNARKFDGRVHRTWQAELIEAEGQLLVLKGVFEESSIHADIGPISKGTVSYEYYWLNRWFNVFRFHEPDGTLKNHYCNVNLPPTFKDSVLDYVDLDLDILVNPDWSFKILDSEEFHENASRYRYDEQVRIHACEQIEVLIKLIESRSFPFTCPP